MRTWTLAEANAALPRVRQVVQDGRAVMGRIRDADAQIADLRIVHGEIDVPGRPGYEEYIRYLREREEAVDELTGVALRFEAIGAELKDLDEGLVDFRGTIGRDEVNLCWRWNEPTITHWHTLTEGFANRREIPGAPQG